MARIDQPVSTSTLIKEKDKDRSTIQHLTEEFEARGGVITKVGYLVVTTTIESINEKIKAEKEAKQDDERKRANRAKRERERREKDAKH